MGEPSEGSPEPLGESEDAVLEHLAVVFRQESRRVFATLVRLLGDFDRAEDALQDAFAAAAEQWPINGTPDNPRAWLVSTGRFKAIDRIRRASRFDEAKEQIAEQLEARRDGASDPLQEEMEDDRLRLIFTCCHPALSFDARVAMTLREICGLTTEEIARAFLVKPATLAQRIVRAKRKIHDAGIPYKVPEEEELHQRLDAVLRVVYLVFNEGYTATTGSSLTRSDLTDEAIHLGRMLRKLLPEPEVTGLLALMLLQDSRRTARTTPDGDLIRLSDQDRSLWNRDAIEEGIRLVSEAIKSGPIGRYTLQAAIAAEHARATNADETDWRQIVAYYDLLLAANPSPVVELNRAVAISMRDSPEAGLRLVNAILERGDLREYHLAHAARADLHRQAGQHQEAIMAYEEALQHVSQEAEQRFLRNQLNKLQAG